MVAVQNPTAQTVNMAAAVQDPALIRARNRKAAPPGEKEGLTPTKRKDVVKINASTVVISGELPAKVQALKAQAVAAIGVTWRQLKMSCVV